ncbi:MAG: Holliday junction branch migration protein RuvA [Candidatus Dormibacteraeota bacterium]|nr:Holliday junction branch migration protein RuvA [Candidatus Dormibacteraeota bacterium]
MIALLRGRLAEIAADHVVLDTPGGTGYEVFCHLRTLAALHARKTDEVTLHVHTSVSEDAIRLFGFTTTAELRLFKQLIGVERIGPKVALGILGRAELTVMVRAIRGGDVALVATVPGIGRKTAERVILELRDKLEGVTMTGEAAIGPPAVHEVADTAVEGLVGLGFREPQARAAVKAAAAAMNGDRPDVASLVAAALRRLDNAGTTR